MTRAVIFDLDGVLVDSYEAHFESWVALADQTGATMTEAQFKATFGQTSREIIRQLWPGELSEDRIRELDLRKESIYREILRRDFPLMDGALELIDALHEAGFALAIGSSGPPENIQLSLDGLGRRSALGAVVTGHDVVRGKPDPQVFQIAAQRLGVSTAACAVVEDAPAGVTAANSAGMTSIALVGTVPAQELQHAKLVVSSLRQLSPQVISDLIDPISVDARIQ